MLSILVRMWELTNWRIKMYTKITYVGVTIMLLLISNIVNSETKQEIKQKENAMISQSDEGLVIEKLASGADKVDLKGRYQMFSKIKVVNGKQVFICNEHSGADHAAHNKFDLTKVQSGERAVK